MSSAIFVSCRLYRNSPFRPPLGRIFFMDASKTSCHHQALTCPTRLSECLSLRFLETVVFTYLPRWHHLD